MKRMKANMESGKYNKTLWSLVMLGSVIGLAVIINRHSQSDMNDLILAFTMGMIFTIGLMQVIVIPFYLNSIRKPVPAKQEDENTITH